VQKHLEYHLQLHAQPDAFACDIDGCGKQFSNPSSLRIHKLLDHERPDEESNIQKQLRETVVSTSTELEQAKRKLQQSQAKTTVVSAEARELRKQSRQRDVVMQSLRREHSLLMQMLHGVHDGQLEPRDAPPVPTLTLGGSVRS